MQQKDGDKAGQSSSSHDHRADIKNVKDVRHENMAVMKHGMPFTLFLRAKTTRISGNRKIRHALHVEKAVFSMKEKQAMERYSRGCILGFSAEYNIKPLHISGKEAFCGGPFRAEPGKVNRDGNTLPRQSCR